MPKIKDENRRALTDAQLRLLIQRAGESEAVASSDSQRLPLDPLAQARAYFGS
jgi:hypothetical protein